MRFGKRLSCAFAFSSCSSSTSTCAPCSSTVSTCSSGSFHASSRHHHCHTMRPGFKLHHLLLVICLAVTFRFSMASSHDKDGDDDDKITSLRPDPNLIYYKFTQNNTKSLGKANFLQIWYKYFSGEKAAKKNETEKPVSNVFSDPTKMISSFAAITIISLVGLMGVAVVPLVQKKYFNTVIQFLVALAVGSLTGDAMLHLLPHAIQGGGEGEEHEHDEGNEQKGVMKGLVALGGIYFFFLSEKILSMISEYRAEKKAEEEERQRVLKDPKRNELRRLSQMRLSNVDMRNAGGCAGGGGSGAVNYIGKDDAMFRRLSKIVVNEEDEGFITTGLGTKALKNIENLRRYSQLDDQLWGQDQAASSSLRQSMEAPHSFLTVPGQATPVVEVTGAEDEAEIKRGTSSKNEQPGGNNSAKEVLSKDEDKDHIGGIQIAVPSVAVVKTASQSHPDQKSEHSHEAAEKSGGVRGEGKSGGHGHSHEVPESIAAVAWMVIMGDGLHNFTDGMAIGAAFAKGASDGISTSVAVFCHELPHELGDFAVLLKTGMSIKQALFYNIVSSVLGLLGMLVGLALGNVSDASYWIFAVTGGIFIYIALVDMLPELSSAEIKPGESRIGHLLLQNAGIFTGITIMLLIALYEDKIKNMFNK